MIRYNANAPEIKNQSQYNVMKGFGVWSLVCGSLLTLWMIRFLYTALSTLRRTGLSLFDGAVILVLIILSFGMGWGVINKKPNTPRFVSRLCNIMTGLIIANFCIIFVVLSMYLFTEEYIGFTRIVAYFYSLIIYILPLILFLLFFRYLKNTFQQPYMFYYHNRRNEEAPQEKDNDEDLEPQTVTLFEDWSPLRGYGHLLWCLGLTLAVLPVVFIIYCKFNSPEIFDKSFSPIWFVLILIPFGIVISVSGHGLSKNKEWGRMMSIVIHVLMMLVLLRAVLGLTQDNTPETQSMKFQHSFFGLLIIIITCFHWCYFVIRTLTSPVVKYVCLRGGYDID